MSRQNPIAKVNRQRARRAERRAAGICIECKLKAFKVGRCKKHYLRNKEWVRLEVARWIKRKIAAGLCRQCGRRKPIKGRPRCKQCLEHSREYQRKKRKERAAKLAA